MKSGVLAFGQAMSSARLGFGRIQQQCLIYTARRSIFIKKCSIRMYEFIEEGKLLIREMSLPKRPSVRRKLASDGIEAMLGRSFEVHEYLMDYVLLDKV